MTQLPPNPDKPIEIRGLYPDLTDEELHEAELNLTRYAELALRIFERRRRDAEHPDRDEL